MSFSHRNERARGERIRVSGPRSRTKRRTDRDLAGACEGPARKGNSHFAKGNLQRGSLLRLFFATAGSKIPGSPEHPLHPTPTSF